MRLIKPLEICLKDKAPRINSYPIEFFTLNWEVVKEVVYATVQKFQEMANIKILELYSYHIGTPITYTHTSERI